MKLFFTYRQWCVKKDLAIPKGKQKHISNYRQYNGYEKNDKNYLENTNTQKLIIEKHEPTKKIRI